jgi:hypothetical protein
MFELERGPGSDRGLFSTQEQSGSALTEDCGPWTPATHPEGALYFFDSERVRVSVTIENSSYD